jgi:AraC-like DNA-binding protein
MRSSVDPTVTVLAPPYRARRALPDAASVLPFGSVLLMTLGAAEARERRHSIGSTVRMLKGRFPLIPAVVFIRGDLDTSLLHFVRCSVPMQLRAVVIGRDPDPDMDALRHQLTSPVDLPRELAGWFRAALPAREPALLPLETLLAGLHRRGSVSGALTEMGLSPRTASDRFRRTGLPSPREWRKLLRALRAMLAAQADPDVSLSRLALDHGYGDHQSLARATRSLFDLTPSDCRRILGWEWLATHWLERASLN